MSTHLLGRTDNVNSSLFTPDFGQSPHVLAGRDAMLGTLLDGLDLGPRDPRFTSVLIGHRGSGKTVILNEVEDQAASAGWIVLSTDATTPGIYDRLNEEMQAAAADSDDLGPVRTDGAASTETEFRVGTAVLGWGRKVRTEMGDDWSMKRKLELLGRHAASRGSAVLITVDELQAGNRDELRRLSADLQMVTKRQELPVAFVGAGLPAMEFTVMRDPKMTFFHRCHDIPVELLDAQSAMSFYKQMIDDGGGTGASDAIALMAHESDGHPFKMQVIGENAWQIAGAPDKVIDLQSAELAIDAAESRMRARVYRPLWDSLGDRHKEILRLLAAHGGATARSTLGKSIDRSASSLSTALRELSASGCVAYVRGSPVSLSALAPLAFVRDVTAEEAALTGPEEPEQGS